MKALADRDRTYLFGPKRASPLGWGMTGQPSTQRMRPQCNSWKAWRAAGRAAAGPEAMRVALADRFPSTASRQAG